MSRADQPTTTGTPRRYEPPIAVRTDWLTTVRARRPDRNVVPPSWGNRDRDRMERAAEAADPSAFETFAVQTFETVPAPVPPRWFDEPSGLVAVVAPEPATASEFGTDFLAGTFVANADDPIDPSPIQDQQASEPSLAPAEGVKADREVSRQSDATVPTTSWTQPRRMRRSVVATLAFLGGGLTLSAVDRAWLRDSAAPAPAVPVVTRDDWQALRDGQQALEARLAELSARPTVMVPIPSPSMPLSPLPAPSPAVDLSPLELRLKAISERVEGLGRQLEPVAGLPVQFLGVGEHLGAIDVALERLRKSIPQQTVALKPSAGSAEAPGSPAGPVAATATGTDPRGRLYALGVELFRNRRYEDLRDTFRVGCAIDPQDARAWYFAGLASSLLAGRLDREEAAGLFRRGAALERAGKTRAADVESTFAFLAETNEKAWLDYYRFEGDTRSKPSKTGSAR